MWFTFGVGYFAGFVAGSVAGAALVARLRRSAVAAAVKPGEESKPSPPKQQAAPETQGIYLNPKTRRSSGGYP